MTTRIATAVIEFELDGKKFVAGVDDSDRRLKGFSERAAKDLKAFGRSATDAGRSLTLGLTAPIVGVATAAVMAFGGFDDSMTKSLAIMGNVSTEMRGRMSDAAREVAKTTTFSASQAADAYFFLASAGLDATQSIEAMPKVAKFAQAGNFELALATDLLTDAQSALGMTIRDDVVANMENMTRVSDVLVKANTLANATVQQFSEALTNKAGNSMRDLNIEVESGVAVLAVWADQGVKGAEAGERFNIVTRDMQTAARNNAAAFKAMGIAVFDETGKFRPLADIIRDMEEAFTGLSHEQKGAAMAALGFTDRSIAATRSLLGSSDAIRRYEEGLKSAGGVTDEVAAKQLESFKAQMTLLWHRVQDVVISLGEELVPVLMEVVDALKPAVDKAAAAVAHFGDLPRPIKLTGLALAGLLAAIGPVLLVVGQLALGLGAILPWFAKGTVAAKVIGGAFAFLTGPIGLTIAAVVGLIAIWKVWGDDIVRIVSSAVRAVKTWLVDRFGPILRPVRDLLVSVGEMFQMFGKLVAATVGIVARDVSNAVGKIVSWLRDVLGPVFQPIAERVQIIATVFKVVMEKVVGFARDLYAGVKRELVDRFTGLVDGIREKVEMVTGFFGRMYDKVVGHSYVPDMMKGIAQSFGGLQDGMVKPTREATGQVVQAFGEQTRVQKYLAGLTTETTKETKKAKKEAEEYAKKIRDLADALGGKETITKAKDYLGVLVSIGGVQKLTKERQQEVIAVMAEAIDSYKALGEQVPPQIRKVHDELLRLVTLPKLITEANVDAARISRELLEQQRARDQKAFGEFADRHVESLRIAREFADKTYLSQLTATERMVELARRQRAESIWAIEPIKTAFPEIYRQALMAIEQEFTASLTFQKSGWSGFLEDLRETFTGGNGIRGLLDGFMGQLGQSGGVMGEVFKIGSAVSRAFAGDFSGAMQLAQQYFAKLVDWVGQGIRKIGGWFKSLFGGASAKELGGREVAGAFRDTVASMMNERQTVEAGNNEWAKSVIVVRDAYLAMGKTEAEALAAMDRLWKAEKEGAGAVEEAIKPIQAALDFVKTKAEETGLSLDELRAAGMGAGAAVTSSIADVGRQLDLVGSMGDQAAASLRESLGRLSFDIPVGFKTGGSTLPAIPMEDGGFGRVTRPTLFYSAGQEDFAFSGEGKSFGQAGAAAGQQQRAQVFLDGKRVGYAILPGFTGALRASL